VPQRLENAYLLAYSCALFTFGHVMLQMFAASNVLVMGCKKDRMAWSSCTKGKISRDTHFAFAFVLLAY